MPAESTLTVHLSLCDFWDSSNERGSCQSEWSVMDLDQSAANWGPSGARGPSGSLRRSWLISD